MPSCRLYCGITPRKAGERCRWSLSKAQSVCAAFCAGCSASKKDKKNTGAGGCSGIFCGTSFFCGIGQIQHRAKGVKDEVLDAIISQKSFKIVVETKLHNQFQQNQLEKHLTQFGTEEIKVLLTLDPKPMKESLMDSFGIVLKKYNADKINEIKTPIRHVNITFEQLVAAMEDIVDERDSEIMAVLDDYKKYCFDEKLIPDDENWMRAIVAGTTLEDNLKYDFYYDQASRGYSGHGYIGLYKEKSIRAIGKLKKTVVAELVNGEVSYINESGEAATKEEIEKIKEAIVHAESEYGYNLKTVKHRYFIVEHFYPTDFKKASKNPIQKSKYFNLAQMFKSKTLPKTDEMQQEKN